MSKRKTPMNGTDVTFAPEYVGNEPSVLVDGDDTPLDAPLTWAQKQYLIQGVVRYLCASDDTDLSNPQDYGTGKFTVAQLFAACERMEIPCTMPEVKRVVNGLVNGDLLAHPAKSRLYHWNHERQHRDRAFFASLRQNLPNR